MSLHVTQHFDAGDIDKFNDSPFRRTNIVYHAKKRFTSPAVNMHYSTTFEAVGGTTGDKQLDDMRFRTTQRDQHNDESVKFGANANPKTVFETMAKQSRMKACVDGKPRGLLAHSDFGKQRNSVVHNSSLQDAGKGLMSPKRDNLRTPQKIRDSQKLKDQRNSHSCMVGTDKTYDLLMGTGRYATTKKDRKKDVRPVSLVDVHHRRDVEQLQKKLYQQMQHVKMVGQKAPHTNYDFLIHPKTTSNSMNQTQMAKQNVKHDAARDYGMKSLYKNDMSNYMDAMQISQKKGAQRGGNGGYGSSAQPTSYTLGHGDPLWRRTGNMDAQLPDLEEMQKSYPSISKETYEQLLRSKPYQPKHHLRPKGQEHKPVTSLGGPFNEKVKDGLDLAEQERINRFKYGIKKPANKWFHEMDDNRITGDQIRTTNFRGSMFERDQEAQRRAGNLI